MIRSLLVISLALVVCITRIAVDRPIAAGARTLDPDAVWSIVGGSTHGPTCCSASSQCAFSDLECDDPNWTVPCYQRVEIDAHPGNVKFCFQPQAGANCTQADEPDWHDCETKKQCNADGGACNAGSVIQTQRAPNTCNPNCL